MRPSSILLLVFGASCQLTFNDDLVYVCSNDFECGGGGYRCLAGICCRSTGPDLCGDGKDNDCDGRVDGEGAREICNGLDDDCDGETDEGFDLQHEPANCGACGNACDAVTEYCNAGRCELRPEIDCHNGFDEDEDGAADCRDPSCHLLSCGEGCVCKDLAKAEVSCADGNDADGDHLIDCADPDCGYLACGDGCTCLERVRHETACLDRMDNDEDGEADCADLSCKGQLCLEGTTRRCAAGQCRCNGGEVESEDGVSCGDDVDNDCDGLTDCQEPSCDALSCGTHCVCVGPRKAERSCEDQADDDGDGLVDCEDLVDCPERSACTAVLLGSTRLGQCSATGACITEFCFDGADNDGDGLADCEDSDCFGASCQADGAAACLCIGGAKTETQCGDGLDNDGDGLRDCGDEVDCPAGTACIKQSNGSAGFCQAANKACN